MEELNVENGELMEFALLEKKFLSKFDYEKTEENVIEIMNKFFKAQYKYTGIKPPRMTANYDLRYECFNSSRCKDGVGDYVQTKCDTKQEIQEFYKTMAGAISRMSLFERVYYTEYMLNGKSERYTADRIGLSRNGLKPIRISCIVKIAIAFGVEVEK